MSNNGIAKLGSALVVEVELGESQYGTPRPFVRVKAPKSLPPRQLSAALHAIVASVEFGTSTDDKWAAYVDHPADSMGFVYLELFDGSEAEVSRALERLREAVKRLPWT